MIKDYVLIILRNFSRRKLRGWLTIIGILIGIAAVISLVSLGQGLSNYVDEQFEQMGSDKIMILPGQGMMGFVSGNQLTPEDIDTIKKVNGVKLVGGDIFESAKVRFGDETKDVFVIGVPQDETKDIFMSMSQFKILKGRDLRSDDQKKVLIGIALHEDDVFERNVELRDTLIIKGEEFEVVGILERVGNPSDDSQLYINLEEARDIFNVPENFGQIMAQIIKGTDAAKVAEDIKKELRQLRDVEEGDEDFSVQTSEQMLKSFSSILSIIQVVIIGIAMISLLVGGIGIMNTMYTSVMERTREIGIMKAVGAANSDIALLFLIESGLMGLVGGLMGLGIGAGISKAVEFGAAQAGYGILKVSFTPTLIFGALFFSFAAGALSGTLPAMQASKMKPVEALRYE